MSICSKDEISVVLQAAEILKRNGFSEKINVSKFCQEAGISRKNAYKHKKRIDVSLESLEAKIKELEAEKKQIENKLEHAEKRALEADLYWELRNILVTLNADIKKNGPGWTVERQRLTDRYENISGLLGVEPLNFWE